MIDALIFALALQNGAPSEAARIANRAALAGESWSVSGERLAALEEAESDSAAYNEAQERALVDSVEICRRIKGATSRLQASQLSMEAWQDERLTQPSVTDVDVRATQAEEFFDAAIEARAALSEAQAIWCSFNRP